VSTLLKLLTEKFIKTEKLCEHPFKTINVKTCQNWKLCEHTSKAINYETCQNWKIMWAHFQNY